MKRFILSTLIAAGAISGFGAGTESTLSYQWSYLIDTSSSQDCASSLILLKDGLPVSFNHFGSKTAEDAITFAGVTIATGAATTSTSDNRNLLIIKHGEDGKALWTVYTKEGYVDSANGNIAPTSDGGIVALLKVRSSNNEDLTTPVFVDSNGTHSVTGWNTSACIYNMVALKISYAGLIEWIRPFDQSQLAIGKASSDIKDAVTPYAICVDSDDNIYIGGNFRTPIVAKGEKNGCFAFTPRNVDNYTGDSQTSAGGMFLIKLNSQGEYLDNLKISGSDTRDQISKLEYADGKIYFCGNILGSKDDKVTIGGKELVLPNEFDNIAYGALGTDLAADYVGLVKAYGASDGKHTTQLKNLKIINGDMYMLGAVKGGFGSESSSSPLITTSGTMLEGFALKCNAADGIFKSAHIYGTGISAYNNVFRYNNNTYLYGYRMNATEGVVLEKFSDDDTWTPAADGKRSIVTGGGAPIAYGAAFDIKNKKLYTLSRGNNTFGFYGTEVKSEKPQSFGGLICAYSLDGNTTSVSSPIESSFKIINVQGGIEISTSGDSMVTINTLSGINLYNAEVKAGTISIPLASGIYLVNGHKITVK